MGGDVVEKLTSWAAETDSVVLAIKCLGLKGQNPPAFERLAADLREAASLIQSLKAREAECVALITTHNAGCAKLHTAGLSIWFVDGGDVYDAAVKKIKALEADWAKLTGKPE